MEINNWKGIENYYNEMLRDGYAFKKGTEHLHHAEKDENKKEICKNLKNLHSFLVENSYFRSQNRASDND